MIIVGALAYLGLMKILVLSKQFPYPLNDGASVAIHMLTKGLKEAGAMVDLISYNTTKHPYRGSTEIAQLDHYREIRLVSVDNKPTITGALRNLFSTLSYHVIRFATKEMRELLNHRLAVEDYDVVQIESTHMLFCLDDIRQSHEGVIVMRAHNVEHLIWQRGLRYENNLLKRWYYKLQAQRLKAFEVTRSGQVDAILTVSDVDGSFFKQYQAETKTIAIGMDIPEPAQDRLTRTCLLYTSPSPRD